MLLQQVGPQQAFAAAIPGLRARTKALINFSSTCVAIASTSSRGGKQRSRFSDAVYPRRLFAYLHDVLWFESFVSGTALGIKELQKVLECFGIRGVAKEGTLTTNLDEPLVPQFVQMVRQSGVRDVQFFLDLSDDHAIGMS